MTVPYLKAYQKGNARSQTLTAGFVCYSKNLKIRQKTKKETGENLQAVKYSYLDIQCVHEKTAPLSIMV